MEQFITLLDVIPEPVAELPGELGEAVMGHHYVIIKKEILTLLYSLVSSILASPMNSCHKGDVKKTSLTLASLQ